MRYEKPAILSEEAFKLTLFGPSQGCETGTDEEWCTGGNGPT